MRPSDERLLEILGVTAAEHLVYEALLAASSASPTELAQTTSFTNARVRKLLGTLESKGLVSRSADRGATYIPAPPSVAWEALVLQRQDELNQARKLISRFEEHFRAMPRTNAIDLVEVVSGRDALAQRFVQIQKSAREDVMVFVKAPYVVTHRNELELQALARGVRCRVVYEREGLVDPVVADFLWEYIEAGEEARSHPGLPMKLVLVDHKIGLIPMAGQLDDRIEGALLVYPSSLLDALIALWTTYWTSAMPMTSATELSTAVDKDPSELSEIDSRIVHLLMAGLTAEAIARQLDVAKSTVDRHIGSILRTLEVETRFQAAYKLGLAAGRAEGDQESLT